MQRLEQRQIGAHHIGVLATAQRVAAELGARAAAPVRLGPLAHGVMRLIVHMMLACILAVMSFIFAHFDFCVVTDREKQSDEHRARSKCR